MTRTKRILLGVASITFLAAGAAWLVITGETFREYVRQELVFGLQRATGGKVTLGSLKLQFFPPRVSISDLRITKESFSEPPFLTIRNVEAYPDLATFLGSAGLAALTLHEPRFRIEVLPEDLRMFLDPNLPSLRTFFNCW